jgi:hypothetical protein
VITPLSINSGSWDRNQRIARRFLTAAMRQIQSESVLI